MSDEPAALFTEWLIAAVDAGAPEPHAVVLSTVDDASRPDARVLKDVDDDGWWFASAPPAPSAPSSQARRWRRSTSTGPARLGRSGRAARCRASAKDSARDPPGQGSGRPGRGAGRPAGQHLGDRAELDEAVTAATARVAADPDLVAADRTRYVLLPREVQFVQDDVNRQHVRLRYQAGGNGWSHCLLWQ